VRQRQILQMKVIENDSRKMLLLAPSRSAASTHFEHVQKSSPVYDELLSETQRLRGRLYLEDGAIEPKDLTAGRHQLDSDTGSWHLLILDQHKDVCGCIRYREFPNSVGFARLGVSNAALANSREWGGKLKSAVENELGLSRNLRLPFIEVGGWALAPEIRGTAEALRMSLAMYGLSELLGGAVGISTVTHRNCSASILRRIGGRPLQAGLSELPAYYDSQYGCNMEILRFYSWAPNPRYRLWINELRAQIQNLLVITDDRQASSWSDTASPRWTTPPAFFKSFSPC
jgi:hypothetical protein